MPPKMEEARGTISFTNMIELLDAKADDRDAKWQDHNRDLESIFKLVASLREKARAKPLAAIVLDDLDAALKKMLVTKARGYGANQFGGC